MGWKQVSFLLITVSDDKNMPGISSDKQSKISWSSLELGITLCKSLYVLTVCDPGRVVLTTHSLTNCRYGCNRTNLMLYLSSPNGFCYFLVVILNYDAFGSLEEDSYGVFLCKLLITDLCLLVAGLKLLLGSLSTDMVMLFSAGP